MSKKEYKNNRDETSKVNEQISAYKNSRIVFSTIETQSDIQLLQSMKLSYTDRLSIMRMLNDYAFKNVERSKFTFENARINFSSYEYIPG